MPSVSAERAASASEPWRATIDMPVFLQYQSNRRRICRSRNHSVPVGVGLRPMLTGTPGISPYMRAARARPSYMVIFLSALSQPQHAAKLQPQQHGDVGAEHHRED